MTTPTIEVPTAEEIAAAARAVNPDTPEFNFLIAGIIGNQPIGLHDDDPDACTDISWGIAIGLQIAAMRQAAVTCGCYDDLLCATHWRERDVAFALGQTGDLLEKLESVDLPRDSEFRAGVLRMLLSAMEDRNYNEPMPAPTNSPATDSDSKRG